VKSAGSYLFSSSVSGIYSVKSTPEKPSKLVTLMLIITALLASYLMLTFESSTILLSPSSYFSSFSCVLG